MLGAEVATGPHPTDDRAPRRPAAWWGLVVDLALILACGAVAGLMQQDANWDQLQYHYWYPWQLFHGGFTDSDLYGGRFQNPLAQVPFYLAATYLTPLAAQIALGAIAGVALVITRRIATRVLPLTGGWLIAVSAAAALLAAVGAGFRSELGTSYADVLLACLLLGALLLVLRGNALAAGLLTGAAVGLKYTSAPFAIAGLAALLIMGTPLIKRTALWALGAVIGWLALGGAWAWHLWSTYNSPVFPFWNSLFASPWYPQANLTDPRYGVDGWDEALRWPWDAATGAARMLDLPVRDPRWLLLVAAVVLILVAIRRVNRAGLATIGFTLVGTLAWLLMFGVIRYALPAELLVAVLVALAISLHAGPRTTFAITLALAVAAGLWTQSADSRRVERGQQWFEVAPTAFEAVGPGDAVLVDGQYPSTFALPGQLPPNVSVHVVQKDYTSSAMRQWLADDLDRANTVWVVTDKPDSQVDGVVGTIDYADCTKIETNVVNRWLCPVRR